MIDKCKKRYEQCRYCKKHKEDVYNRRRNTRYVDDSKNYMMLCKRCFEEDQEMYS